ncbi:MAG: hypothetical protein MUF34_14570 [Polyangiaceae bacterium]|nr:hypothetical protein [Polyangiaceae bacterium]
MHAGPGSGQKVAMVELGPRGRGLFALTFFATQLVLVATANGRPERAFGFQMFPESTMVSVRLFREVGRPGGPTRRVHVEGGAWRARDAAGALRDFAWHDRVRFARISVFDEMVFASYGAAAYRYRLRAALEDVVRHLEGDAETRRLVAELSFRVNGRPMPVETIASSPR